jgi:hypothetical protein
MDGNLLFEEVSSDCRQALQPPAGKSDRGFIPPEVIRMIIEKVAVNIIGALLGMAYAKSLAWWNDRKKSLAEEVKGAPTPELAAKSQPLLDDTKTRLVEELAKVPPKDLAATDRPQLTHEVRVVLIDFHFSDAEADRVSRAMVDAVLARIAGAQEQASSR